MPSLGCCMDHYWCNSRMVCWCELFIPSVIQLLPFKRYDGHSHSLPLSVRQQSECQLLAWVILINGDGGCGYLDGSSLSAGLAGQVRWLGLCVGSSICIHHTNQVNSCNGLAIIYTINTVIMAALCNRGAIIFLPCGFFFLSIFYLSIFFFLA